jgi:hypothetical protein
MALPMRDRSAKRMDVEEAAQDLRWRTLAKIERPLDRLIYLASTRDYNTGMYYHDGLAARFNQDIACQALAECHREAFRELVGSSLKELVAQVEGYIATTHTSPAEFIAVWRGLEPYRVAVPVEADMLSTELLFSNLKVALAVLEHHLIHRSKEEQVA